jgi:hypothetical protein
MWKGGCLKRFDWNGLAADRDFRVTGALICL